MREVAHTAALALAGLGLVGATALLPTAGAATGNAAADGSGRMDSATATVTAGSTGNTIVFTYTAGAGQGGLSNGTVTLAVPSVKVTSAPGWSPPSTTPSAAGYTTSSAGVVSVSGQTITVSGLTLTDTAPGNTVTITYGDTSGGGPGAIAIACSDAHGGDQSWVAQEQSTPSGTLTTLGFYPNIPVTATKPVRPFFCLSSGLTQTLYGTGISNSFGGGALGVAFASNGDPLAASPASGPGGFLARFDSSSTTSMHGSPVHPVTIDGDNADLFVGLATSTNGRLYANGSSGVVQVDPSTGTTLAGPAPVGGTAVPGNEYSIATDPQTGDLVFADGSDGDLSVTPPDLSSVGTFSSGALTGINFSQADGMTFDPSGNQLFVAFPLSDLIVVLDRSGGLVQEVTTAENGPDGLAFRSGAHPFLVSTNNGVNDQGSISEYSFPGGDFSQAPTQSVIASGGYRSDQSSVGPDGCLYDSQIWTQFADGTIDGNDLSLARICGGFLQTLPADGTGTLTTPTSGVAAGSTGNTIVFTYTAAAGGLANGTVTLQVPAGWSAPSTTGSSTGFSTASAGSLAVSGQKITVSGLTLAGGGTFMITYGAKSGGGAGATATSSTGTQTWQAQERSTPAGALTNLASSPSITVTPTTAPDGSGTLTTPTSSVIASSSGHTIVFTYTAAAGGLANGTVTLQVPADWLAPSTTASSTSYTTSSAGALSVSGRTITVSGLTLAGGGTVTITYGDKSGGGIGAFAPGSAAVDTWQAKEKSTAAGALTNLASSPVLTTAAADGSGTLTTPTSGVLAGATGNTIVFTYTAPDAGLKGGVVTLAVPSGWSAPSTTASAPGDTTSSRGTLGVSGRTITVSGLTVGGANTFTITYGDKTGGGAGATAPTATGDQTWQAQEKSTTAGTLTNLAGSPVISVLTTSCTTHVTSTADSGPGSLRTAMACANLRPGLDTIDFAIGSGARTIQPTTQLPTITDPVVIDGTTQPGFTGRPLIRLDGGAANTFSTSASGLVITAGGSSVRGLELTLWNTAIKLSNGGGDAVTGSLIGTDGTSTQLGNSTGIEVDSATNTIGGTTPAARNVISGNSDGIAMTGNGNVVEGNYIGTNAAGTAALGTISNVFGVDVEGSNNTIGGVAAGAANVISGNQFGVGIFSDASFSGPCVKFCATGNLVGGNLIGTNSAGTAAIGNVVGVAVGADTNTIGGTTSSARNVISGNTLYGVEINGDESDLGFSAANGDVVEGNLVGTNAAGTAALPNGHYGVYLENGAATTTVGGTTAGSRNLISGNGIAGVGLFGSTNSTVEGNYIGTNAAGTAALPNKTYGVFVQAAGNTIGGTSAAARNLISGNGNTGVAVYGSGTTGNLVEGNTIGANAGGAAAVPNSGFGVAVYGGATGNTIGGSAAGARNLISGNGGSGVTLQGAGTSGNVVQGNVIGTNAGGTAALPNVSDGVAIFLGATGNTVGGAAAGTGNLISGNGSTGVGISGSGTAGNFVQGNTIGANAAGTAALANSTYGVAIFSAATNNTVGGTVAGARNLISGNGNTGVGIYGTGTSGNDVEGNTIGANAGRTAALPNSADGVAIFSAATDNTVGGTAGGAQNLISGNGSTGVVISGSGTSGNVVEGNVVGANAAGTSALPNAIYGVAIFSAATANTVGGTAAGARNLISGNGNTGVGIYGTGTSGNDVEGNTIGANAAGTAALPNTKYGVSIFSAASNNTIGGLTAGAGNILSGNGNSGVLVTGSGTTNNFVEGNDVGTNPAGTAAVANGSFGVAVLGGAHGNVVGGTAAGAGNLISGNSGSGVTLQGAGTSGNLMQGNKIGTDAAGTGAIANTHFGVAILVAATNNKVGGTAAGAGNLISGNGDSGVTIQGAGTAGNLVQGNEIGTDAAGTGALPNSHYGAVIFAAATGNTIGGTAVGAGNLVSGNSIDGVGIYGSGTSGNLVEGNRVGTNAAGSAALPNTLFGVAILAAATNNTVGGTAAGAGNLISGNGDSGVTLQGTGTSGNRVQGNKLGTDAAGTGAVANAKYGVAIVSAATNNTVGGTAAGSENLISGNGDSGVLLQGAGTSGDLVQSNQIGTDAAGTGPVANAKYGVAIVAGATNNTVGGTAAGAGNLLSGNGYSGVGIYGSGTTGNLVEGNDIGTDAAHTGSLPNADFGVTVFAGATSDTIGGTVVGTGNLIAHNPVGIDVDGAATAGVAVLGNSIFANTSFGIELTSGGNGNETAPSISSVTSGSNTTIKGSVTSGGHRVEVFLNPSCGDPEGAQFLGSVSTSSGAWSLTVGALAAGQGVTATATNSSTHNTSTFSLCTSTP